MTEARYDLNGPCPGCSSTEKSHVYMIICVLHIYSNTTGERPNVGMSTVLAKQCSFGEGWRGETECNIHFIIGE